MEVNEVASRLLRRYWAVLVLAILVPVLAVGAFVLRTPATYTAHARIVAAQTIPVSTAAAAAVVSQVQAIATSRDVVAEALSTAHLDRSADAVVAAVTVTGLGGSALVDLAYTDHNPDLAQQVTAALATTVTARLDSVRIGGLPDVLKDVDNQLTDLATKRAPIAAAAQANPKDPVAQNKLAGIDRLISDLSGDRNRLAEEAAAAGHASLVDAPAKPADSDPRGLGAKLAVAVILGLLVALMIIGINETVRPAVSGASRVARVLDVPLLGVVSSDQAVLADLGRRLRLAARRANVSTITLVRATRTTLPPELVDRIEAATLRPDSVPGRVSVPIEALDTHQLGMPVTGTGSEPSGRDGVGMTGSVAVLTVNDNSTRPSRLRRVCSLDELDPSAEGDRIGLVVLAGGSTRLSAVDSARDLSATAGWPLLGVMGDAAVRVGRR